jgi:hypothetical protein
LADVDYAAMEAELDAELAAIGTGASAPAAQSAPVDYAAMEQELDSMFMSDGEVRPAYARGDSPDMAINKSPLSVDDRAKISVGNEKGIEKFLTEKYGEVKKDANGDLVVNSNGLWHRVDAEGLGEVNPWKATKDLLKGNTQAFQEVLKEGAADLQDILPTVANVAGNVGIAMKTGNLGLLGQAAAAGGTGAGLSMGISSLGKLYGTYDATPGEQMQEAAFETMLNIAGVGIAPLAKGVKVIGGKTASKLYDVIDDTNVGSFVIDSLEAAGQNLKGMVGESKELAAQVLAFAGGYSPDKMYRYMDRPTQVVKSLKSAMSNGRTEGEAISRLQKESLADGVEVVKGTRKALTSYYDDLMGQVKSQIPEGTQFETQKPAQMLLEDLQKRGIIKTVSRARSDGSVLYSKADLVSPDQIEQLALSGNTDPLVTALYKNEASGKQLTELVKSLNVAASVPGKSFDDMIKAEKMLDNSFRDLKDRAFMDGVSKDFIDTISTFKQTVMGNVEAQTQAALKGAKSAKPGLVESYGQLKTKYREAAAEVDDILDVHSQLMKGNYTDMQAGEKLVNMITQSGVKSLTKKEVAESAVSVLGKYNPKILESVDRIADREAAKAFVPKLRKGMVQFAAPLAAGAAYAGSDNANVGLTAGIATAAVTSPRMALSLLKGMKAGKNFLITRPVAELDAFRQSPEAMRMFFQSLTDVPVIEEQAKEALLGQAAQTVQGGK